MRTLEAIFQEVEQNKRVHLEGTFKDHQVQLPNHFRAQQKLQESHLPKAAHAMLNCPVGCRGHCRYLQVPSCCSPATPLPGCACVWHCSILATALSVLFCWTSSCCWLPSAPIYLDPSAWPLIHPGSHQDCPLSCRQQRCWGFISILYPGHWEKVWREPRPWSCCVKHPCVLEKNWGGTIAR